MSSNDLVFKYGFEEDYDPEYVNGIYGGVNSSDELIMHFYLERFPIPYEARAQIEEDGTIDEEDIAFTPEEMKIRRAVKQGIIMNKENAVALYVWLKEKLLEMGVEADDL